MHLDRDAYLPLIDLALAEDLGSGDVTSHSVIPKECEWVAELVAREELRLAGLPVVRAVFERVDPELRVVPLIGEGQSVKPDEGVLTVEGSARSILSAERVALNFVQRLSGIATLTRAYVDALDGMDCQVLDTRKTCPGWRALEKYAVRCGGGVNHRMGLYDQIMIKDNHLAVCSGEATPIPIAIQRARENYPDLKVEVEVDTLTQARVAAESGADIILLDNMSLDQLKASVLEIGGRSMTEASGGITMKTIRAVAETGVDSISVGALTHSARAVDLALDVRRN
tara:strand:+ start:97 stop:948 length:852 start_codon:yes stop_codon:yes gene_type:complete